MKTLIVVKHSKFEWECKNLNLTSDELKLKLVNEKSRLK